MVSAELSRSSKTPMYLQLYEAVKEDILTGRIPGGEKLPSKRELARHLSVSVVTVQNAYVQLLAEGYIVSREKRGYFALSLQRQAPRRTPPPVPEAEALPAAPSGGEFPFQTWARILRSVLLEKGSSLLSPLPAFGAYELRAAVADYLYGFRGMEVSPEQIVIGAGTEYLYGLLIQLLGREVPYCLEEPGYRKLGRIYDSFGVRYQPIPIDPGGLSVSALRQSPARIVHLSPAHHYPTGIVMPIARRQEILSLMAERQGYLIEDDYDSEFRFRGKPIPPIFSIDPSGRVIYMNTFSKTIAPSIRISYMILPRELAERFREKLGFYACTVPAFEQYTLARFIREGYFERHINRTRKKLRARRDLALEFFAQFPQIDVFEEDAGVHFLIHAPEEAEPLLARAREKGMRVTELGAYSFCRPEAYRNYFVVNYEFAELSPFAPLPPREE